MIAIIFFIILFGIKQLNKLWRKTFKTIYQLSCFVGHPVADLRRSADKPSLKHWNLFTILLIHHYFLYCLIVNEGVTAIIKNVKNRKNRTRPNVQWRKFLLERFKSLQTFWIKRTYSPEHLRQILHPPPLLKNTRIAPVYSGIGIGLQNPFLKKK